MITFLILKYDIIENSRIELRGIVLPVQVGGLLGGPKGMLAPLPNYWGGQAPPGPPLPTPMVKKNHVFSDSGKNLSPEPDTEADPNFRLQKNRYYVMG